MVGYALSSEEQAPAAHADHPSSQADGMLFPLAVVPLTAPAAA
jgi:hypothetical protein